jgi:lactate racemase
LHEKGRLAEARADAIRRRLHSTLFNPMQPLVAVAESPATLNPVQITELIARACPESEFRNQRILLIVPDSTRTAPIGLLFQTLHATLGHVTRRFDVLIALGTHQPMSESAICQRLDLTETQRRDTYAHVRFFNHAWNDPAALRRVGVISSDQIRSLSGGLFSLDVPVDVNRLLFDYDRVILLGPVFPHEVVGFSGGNKYLFPGVAGPDILNFFHWLGAVITTPRIIGHKWTPVRTVIDRAAALVDIPKLCLSLVVEPDGSLAGLFVGKPESAWDLAANLSARRHIQIKEQPFHTILSCAPPMYDEIWTAGKCMYKLEPVLADGGELIIYAPHITEVSVTHGHLIRQIGYHCRDYFLNQWEQFRHFPWGVLAHSAHVHGLGTFDNGIEIPRAQVTLATQIPPDHCQRLNLGYRNPASIHLPDFTGREADGILCVPKAGETLYRLRHPPPWALSP